MARTFREVCLAVQARVPLAPALLAADWVQGSYNQICGRKRWSWLRGESEFILSAVNSGTLTVVHGSATVTGVGITFAAADALRQFRISGPPYTILSVDLVLNTALLDRVYGGASAAASTGYVFDGYVTMPADFGSFIAVLDPTREDILDWWMTEDQLNATDPNRSETGDPRALASRRPATATSIIGRMQYEAWPYWVGSTTRPYRYYYSKRPATLTDDDYFVGPLRHRDDILILAAIEEAIEWPGPSLDKPNPYARDLRLAVRKAEKLERELLHLEREDEETYMTWLETVPWNLRRTVSGRDYRSHE